MHLVSTFDIKALFVLGFELKFADRKFVTKIFDKECMDKKVISVKKLRANPDLVKLLGENKVLDLLDFFKAEADRQELKTGTDN